MSSFGRPLCVWSHQELLALFPTSPHPYLSIIPGMITLSPDNLPALESLCQVKLFFHSLWQKSGMKIMNRALPRRFCQISSLSHLPWSSGQIKERVTWGKTTSLGWQKGCLDLGSWTLTSASPASCLGGSEREEKGRWDRSKAENSGSRRQGREERRVSAQHHEGRVVGFQYFWILKEYCIGMG